MVGLWGSGILPRSTETTELQATCLNFPSAWFGEFPHEAPGYLKVKIFTWEHVTRLLGGVALHLTSVWGWGRGCCQLSLPREPRREVSFHLPGGVISPALRVLL